MLILLHCISASLSEECVEGWMSLLIEGAVGIAYTAILSGW